MQTYLEQMTPLRQAPVAGRVARRSNDTRAGSRRPGLRWSLILPLLALLAFWGGLLSMHSW